MTDANGCSASVGVTIGLAAALSVSESHTDVICNDGSGTSDDGTATLTATNGVGTLTYGLTGQPSNNTGIFTGLAAGSYTGTVTDANGCSASVGVTIGLAAALSVSESHTDVICNDGSGTSDDGTATLTATNGVGTLTYGLTGQTSNNTGIFTGLAAGSYTGTVTDANGCSASVGVTIGLAAALSVSESHTDVICNDGSGTSDDGTATLTATNGVAPLTYGLTGQTSNNTGIFTNLAAGSYTGTVTDANGCSASVGVTISLASSLSVSESHTDVICNDGSGTSDDGTATLTATNGVGTLTYGLTGQPSNNTGIFTGLAAGSYTGTVTDANGCSASVGVTIGLAAALSVSESHTDVICNDGSGTSDDGTATLTATNGVGTLTYGLTGQTSNNTGIFTGLAAGSYTGTVTDANGCSASVGVTIGLAAALSVSESHTDVICNDGSGTSDDGTATLTATNGVGTLTYGLTGQTSNNTGIFTGLAAVLIPVQ
ncbi:MAG: hypothetical protein R2730_13955 [Chitinophagales bacterium]